MVKPALNNAAEAGREQYPRKSAMTVCTEITGFHPKTGGHYLLASVARNPGKRQKRQGCYGVHRGVSDRAIQLIVPAMSAQRLVNALRAAGDISTIPAPVKRPVCRRKGCRHRFHLVRRASLTVLALLMNWLK